MIGMAMRIPLLAIKSLQDWAASVELYVYWASSEIL